MANELANERKIYLDFKPASLDMTNYEELKKEVEKYASKYEGLIFTRDDKSGANQARTELLSLQNAIEAERKNVEQVYNQPLNDFKKQIKILVEMINNPLNGIRDGLKVIEEAEKSEREEALKMLIAEKIEGLDVSIEELEQNNKWLNAGNWSAKLKPKNSLVLEVENIIQQTLKEKERKESEIKILTEFCKAKDVDPDGWVSQLKYRSAMEVIQSIQDSIAAQKEREERMAIKEGEREALLVKREKEHEELTKINVETLETAKMDVVEIPQTILEERLLIRGSKSQFEALNKFLVTSGIEVSPIPEVAIDDLPWE